MLYFAPRLGREVIEEGRFYGLMGEAHPPEVLAAVRKLADWCSGVGLKVDYRLGQSGPVIVPVMTRGKKTTYPISILSSRGVAIQMRFIKTWPPFDSAGMREQLRDKLQGLEGFTLGRQGMEGMPRVPLSTLADEGALRTLIGALDWVMGEVGAAR